MRRADTLFDAGAFDPRPPVPGLPQTAPCQICGERGTFRGAEAPRYQIETYVCGACREDGAEE